MELIKDRLVINKFTESDKDPRWQIEKNFEVRNKLIKKL